MSQFRNLVVGLLISSAFACSDGDGGDNITLDAFLAQAVVSTCNAYSRCYPNGTSPLGASCAARFGQEVDRFKAPLKGAIEAKRVAYDSAKASACLTRLETISCDQIDTFECDEAFGGTRSAGQGCFVDEECTTGDCSQDNGNTCGVCSTIVAVNGDCSAPTASCGENAYCSGQNRCVALGNSGDACDKLAANCQFGLSCVGAADSANGTCRPGAAQGQPCAGGTAPGCATALYCMGDSLTTPGTCQPYGARNAGQTCFEEQFLCTGDLDCVGADGAQTCSARPSLGQACHGDLISRNCQDLTFCTGSSGAAGTCVALKSAGAACTDSDECASPLTCSAETNGTCIAQTYMVCGT